MWSFGPLVLVVHGPAPWKFDGSSHLLVSGKGAEVSEAIFRVCMSLYVRRLGCDLGHLERLPVVVRQL